MESSQTDGTLYPAKYDLYKNINFLYTDKRTKFGQVPGIVKFQNDYGLRQNYLTIEYS